mmetsp:Transcript_23476/g.36167  ORF Transcript_23476/g.36167 Transcript_23476/m.36167 type:complete len:102 (-) Transcript_23476:1746-2051(-)
MTRTVTGLTAGTVYRIYTIAHNDEGDSTQSDNLEKAATALPDAPGTITKVSSLSSQTSIALSWDKVADQDVETSGYYLWMAADSSGSSEFVIAMNGTGQRE